MFDRRQRKLVLSRDGERLLNFAQKFIALNDETPEHDVGPRAFDGEVRLGVPYDLVARFMPTTLRRFDTRFPNVRVSAARRARRAFCVMY